MAGKQVGHTFLAKLGKKRLRPGGLEATQWLLSEGNFSSESKVLEVACNMGTTLVEVAQKYHCEIIGVDLDKKALEKAKQNIQKAGLLDTVSVQSGNALKLPFEDNTFDIVINEAMLTMLDNSSKAKALKEYYRVLKPGGKLLTHDISLSEPNEQLVNDLSRAINMRVAPLTLDSWQKQYANAGFRKVKHQTGAMSLMNPRGMIRDEGFRGAFMLIKNGLKKENREQFMTMFRYFKKEQKNMQYIANCAEK
ncbi:methyltransferase domain-containing protein [Enterococcus sp. BWB1-3]|uniref:class I SAM-dependent methyltransferase n=1 Tax=Enterococcus sp. BWB1-3 TaxID=2787713 RepID=UPI001922BF7A|nr:class I SAM-dependent methyltransferase [Enterococcus sp. BWB1-3]MBL1229258.1 methyltransferase domain-containing protein [Enterococcus sp. BWB1-3]